LKGSIANMEKKLSNFGTWLKNAIKECGWSQAELTRRANVSRSAINGIINGNRNPGRDLLLAFSMALNLPAEELFQAIGGRKFYDRHEAEYAEWIKIFLNADDVLRKELLDLAWFWNDRKRKRV